MWRPSTSRYPLPCYAWRRRGQQRHLTTWSSWWGQLPGAGVPRRSYGRGREYQPGHEGSIVGVKVRYEVEGRGRCRGSRCRDGQQEHITSGVLQVARVIWNPTTIALKRNAIFILPHCHLAEERKKNGGRGWQKQKRKEGEEERECPFFFHIFSVWDEMHNLNVSQWRKPKGCVFFVPPSSRRDVMLWYYVKGVAEGRWVSRRNTPHLSTWRPNTAMWGLP